MAVGAGTSGGAGLGGRQQRELAGGTVLWWGGQMPGVTDTSGEGDKGKDKGQGSGCLPLGCLIILELPLGKHKAK